MSTFDIMAYGFCLLIIIGLTAFNIRAAIRARNQCND
jgi:hypothetical protein